jgi:hypothetical protein
MYVNDQILSQGGPEFRAATVLLAKPFQGQEWEYIPDGNPDHFPKGLYKPSLVPRSRVFERQPRPRPPTPRYRHVRDQISA